MLSFVFSYFKIDYKRNPKKMAGMLAYHLENIGKIFLSTYLIDPKDIIV